MTANASPTGHPHPPIDPHLHRVLYALSRFAGFEDLRPVKCPDDRILMQFVAACPGCGAGSAFSVALAVSGRVLLNCHGATGCTIEKILDGLGLTKSALFPPPVGNGQPAYDHRKKSDVIDAWMRARLFDRLELASEVIRACSGIASKSLVKQRRKELGVRMLKIGFPAVPYWILGSPVTARVPSRGTIAGAPVEPETAENHQIASNGAGSYRGTSEAPAFDVENPQMASSDGAVRRGTIAKTGHMSDCPSVDSRDVAELCGPPQRDNRQNHHVTTTTRTQQGGEHVHGEGSVGNRATRQFHQASDSEPTSPASEASSTPSAETGEPETGQAAEPEIPGGTFDIAAKVEVLPIAVASNAIPLHCQDCGGLEPEFHGYGRHRITCQLASTTVGLSRQPPPGETPPPRRR